MIWRVGDQFVVAVDTTFRVVDRTGAIVAIYAPSEWSAEEDLGRTTFEVRGSRLSERTVVEHWADRPDDVNEIVIFDDLLEDTSAETRRFIDVALGDHAVVREEARLREEREADARVAAIPGSLDPLAGDAGRAQQALVHRIHAYADEDSAALLRTLIDLAATPGAALAAYVRGCLLATFSSAPPLVDGDHSPSPLAEVVAAHAERMRRIGDGQEEADAPRNAAAYWAAADAMRESARMLGYRVAK